MLSTPASSKTHPWLSLGPLTQQGGLSRTSFHKHFWRVCHTPGTMLGTNMCVGMKPGVNVCGSKGCMEWAPEALSLAPAPEPQSRFRGFVPVTVLPGLAIWQSGESRLWLAASTCGVGPHRTLQLRSSSQYGASCRLPHA